MILPDESLKIYVKNIQNSNPVYNKSIFPLSISRWVRIKEFVKCINTTEPQTITKGWEKTRLTESFDFDRQLEDEDAEEEFLLQQKMEELDLNSESETESEDVIEIIPEVADEKKIQKQSQITDFFRSQK